MHKHLMAAAAITVMVSGAYAQTLEIGPGGVRVDPAPRDDRRGPSRDDRRGPAPRAEVTQGEATRIARRQGMVEVEAVTAAGPRWRVEGTDRRGREMRVTIDRRTGEVLQAR